MFVSFIWLLYLSFPLHAIMQRSAEDIVAGITVLLLFAVVYVYSFLFETGRLVLVLAQIALIGYFAYQYDASFLFMGFYPTPVIGMLRSNRHLLTAWLALLALVVFVFVANRNEIAMDDLYLTIPTVLVMLFIPLMIRIGRRSKELKEKLNMANEEIARLSANEERARISRDLHDTLGHSLSLITLKSELTEKLIAKNPERAIQEVRDIQSTSRAALKQVRELVSGLNMATVEDEIIHAKQLLATANISLRIEGEFLPEEASPIINNIMGMCLREAVTNVVRHSGAKECVIERRNEDDRLVLIVADDGCGIADVPAAVLASGHGLSGMKERLKLVEGAVMLESSAGNGTRTVIRVPLVART
ncbi:sensor histidine kinase [Paenibacillus kobensis]|uniref:sensor histidine kinase n=1 Tax=Paenibacillus kobensis TaxID=59841 RepID=UPI001FEA2B9D|nr:sensor histidine kinase [Paenibacillus kobensis]